MPESTNDLDWALEAPMTAEKRAWIRSEFDLGSQRLASMEETVAHQRAHIESLQHAYSRLADRLRLATPQSLMEVTPDA